MIGGNAVEAAQSYKMLYGQLALSAFVFAVLLLAGVQNKGYLLLGISVFDPELL